MTQTSRIPKQNKAAPFLLAFREHLSIDPLPAIRYNEELSLTMLEGVDVRALASDGSLLSRTGTFTKVKAEVQDDDQAN